MPPGRPASGGRLFGRSKVLNEIVSGKTVRNYTIVRNRRICKTSLLHEVRASVRHLFRADEKALTLATSGTGTSATRTLHRIDGEAVKQQVTAAGFTLEASSDLLDNPNDPHDVSPREVEPTSDKFALRFRKPE